MIYIIIGIFISLLFVFFSYLDNILRKIIDKTQGTLNAVNYKINKFNDVLKKYNIQVPGNMFIKTDENFNKLTDIEKKTVIAASNGLFKEKLKKNKLERKLDKLLCLNKFDYFYAKFITGFVSFFTLSISLITFATLTVGIEQIKDKTRIYSDVTNNIKPYEAEVNELLYEIQHGKNLAKNYYWTSFRSKKWLELDETPLFTIKNTKGFNTIPQINIKAKE